MSASPPDWLSVKVTPVGRAPDSDRVTGLLPEALTVNEPAAFSVKVVDGLLEMTSGWITDIETVAVAEPSVPVTVWGPVAAGVHRSPVQLPSGEMVKMVAPVTLPRSLP